MQFSILLSDIPVVNVDGPDFMLERCLSDPDLQLTFPDLHCDNTSNAPYQLRFEHAERCRVFWKDQVLHYQADLNKFSCKEFRRLVMYIAKSAVLHKNCILVHGACVESINGTGFLICGGQGSGKTSLTMKLAGQGFSVKSTDISLIDQSLSVIAGTKHINLYPFMIDRVFEKNSLTYTSKNSGYQQKSSFSLDELCEQKLIRQSVNPVKINYICKIRVIEGEGCAGYHELDFHEKLDDSVFLMEDWTISSWISPDLLQLFPHKHDEKINLTAGKMAADLADIAHYQIRGNLTFHTDLITSIK